MLSSTSSLLPFVVGPGSAKARAGALNLIGNLVLLGGQVVLSYAPKIRQAMLSLLRSDQPAEISTAVLSVLDRLVEPRSLSPEVLKPADILKELLDARQRSGGQYSKKGARPRGAIFRSIGLLVYAYAQCFDDGVRTLCIFF